ncbi:reverse transcriptase domain-containing protein [Tanacetum coccineum]
MAKYLVELGTYNITYDPRNAIKGQVMAEFLSEASIGVSLEEFFRLSVKVQIKDVIEKRTLFTDGASNSKGSDVGLVLISPGGTKFTYPLRLNFTSTNNEAEYEALLVGLRLVAKMKVHIIDVKLNSKLVASQINGDYVASSTSMVKYLATAKECIPVEVLLKWSTDRKEVSAIVEEEDDNWMTPIIRCLTEGMWPEGKDKKRSLRMEINQYIQRKGSFSRKEDENEDELRLNMDLLQEKREDVAIREARYKTKMEQYYNKIVRATSFKPDE